MCSGPHFLDRFSLGMRMRCNKPTHHAHPRGENNDYLHDNTLKKFSYMN
jgi:hypothetical protein